MQEDLAKNEWISEIEKNAIRNILSLFRQVIMAEYEVHLLDLHQALSKKDLSEYKHHQYPKDSAKFTTEFGGQYIKGYRQSLLDSVNRLKSDLYSIINAVHKSQIVQQAYGQIYPFSLNYERVKQGCFEKIKEIDERYSNGEIDRFHSQKISTFGEKFEQRHVHFDPDYYYFQLHTYFNQIECSQILFAKEKNSPFHVFIFQYLLFPLFYHKSGLLSEKKAMFDEIIEHYFSAVSGFLEGQESQLGFQRDIQRYKATFAYTTYEPIPLTENTDLNELERVKSVLFESYQDGKHTFNQPPLQSMFAPDAPVDLLKNTLALQPMQFAFNTRFVKSKMMQKNDPSTLFYYLGDMYFCRYLESDRTGWWLDYFFRLYFQNANPRVLEVLTQNELTIVQYLINHLAQLYFQAETEGRPIELHYPVWNATLTQQFNHFIFNVDYLKGVANLSENHLNAFNLKDMVIDKVFRFIDKNAMKAQGLKWISKDEQFAVQLKLINKQFQANSLIELLGCVYNQPYQNLAELLMMQPFQVTESVMLSENILNTIGYSSLITIYKTAQNLLNYLSEQLKSNRFLAYLLRKEKENKAIPNSNPFEKKELKIINPVFVVSLNFKNKGYLDVSIDDLMFDADEQYQDLILNTFLFGDDKFSPKERELRELYIKDKLDDVVGRSYKVLPKDNFRLINNWKNTAKILELSLNSPQFLTRIKNDLALQLTHENLCFDYEVGSNFAIIVSINV